MRTKKLASLLSLLIVVGAGLSGCDESSRQQAKRQQVVQDVDEQTNQQLRKITGNEAPAEQAPASKPDDPETSNSSAHTGQQPEQPQEKTNQQDQPKPSPLDAAVEKLNNQEVQDDRQPKPVEPREVHEALLPMVQKHWVRLNPGFEVWADMQNRQVIVGGRVSLREGLLEMFACPMDTKEHESVIATVSDAQTVHAGLLATGAVKGMPGYWTDETGVVTAMGTVCNITVVWQAGDQEEDRKEVNAREMVIDLETGKTLSHDWVFAGSRWWQDPDDPGYREYQADWGDMICVSNFPTAMMDLTIESSSSNASLAFGANPEKVPALGQPVLIFIKPDPATAPSEKEVADAIKKRDDMEAKMQAKLDARMKEIEKQEAERKAAADKESGKTETGDSGTGDSGADESGPDESENDKSDG